jgi:uncharacterized membrane protein
MARFLAVALTIGAVVWGALLVTTTTHHGHRSTWFVDGLSSAICHRRPARSFRVDGRLFPVCARCTGLYMSGAVGAILGWIGRRKAPRDSRQLLLLSALPTALTIAVEWFGLSPLSNAIRALAAIPLGAAAGWTFVRLLRAER